MLLARLQGKTKRWLALRVVRDANEPARHVALELIARGEEARVRSAKAERHAEALCGTNRDVRAEFARRLEQREREQVRRNRDSSADLAHGRDQR